MKSSHRIAIGLLIAVITSGLNEILFPPLRLSATMSTDQPPLLSPARPSYDPEVQELIETTYLGHAAEMPDPGEPAVVLMFVRHTPIRVLCTSVTRCLSIMPVIILTCCCIHSLISEPLQKTFTSMSCETR